MDYPTLRRIAFGFILAVLIAVGIVFGVTMALHARHEAARADAAEHKLAETRTSLALTREALGETGTALHTTQDRLAHTSQVLSRTSSQRSALQRQSQNCRYLVRVNDHLLWGMTNYDTATDRLIDGQRARATASVKRASAHVQAIQALVKRSGHRTISDLVTACAPPVTP
jgi:hypothetical protein